MNAAQELVGPEFRIYCEEDWAKNFPGIGRPPIYTSITFDGDSVGIYERWSIEHYEEGYRIRNKGTGFWACAHNGEVDGTPEFDDRTCKWYIERAGDGNFKLSVPNQDSVWTVRRRQGEHPKSLFLEPARGAPNQLFSFGSVVDLE